MAAAASRLVAACDFLLPSCQSAGSRNMRVCVPTTVPTPTVRAVERVSLKALATNLLKASIYTWLSILRLRLRMKLLVSLTAPGIDELTVGLPVFCAALPYGVPVPQVVGSTSTPLPLKQP